MGKSLSVLLSVAALCLGLVSGSGIAHAEETHCLLNSGNEPVGTEDLEVDLGPATVGVAGVQVSICWTQRGNSDLGQIPNWAPPRVEPGICEPSELYDPLCFSVYVDPESAPVISSVTVTTHSRAQQPPDWSWHFPLPQASSEEGPLCLLSVGYPAAPDRDCEVTADLGQ
jgi:hypothetical protein